MINQQDNLQTFANGISPALTINWLLFSGFGVKMSKDKLELLESLSGGNSALVVENTVQAIILGYYRVLLEQEKLKILDQVKKLSGDRYKYEMAKKELGSSVTFDVLQAKNSFYSDSTNYLLQELNLKNAYLNLNLLLAEPPEIKFILTDTFQVTTPEYNLEELKGMMMSNNKNLLNQYINQEILKKEISLQKSAVYPTINLGAGADYSKNWYHDRNFDPLFENNSFGYYANFSLSFNLFNGGNTRRAIEAARINEKIAQLETRELEQTLGNYLLNQYDLYFIRRQLYEVAEVNIESASLNLEISTEKYRNGSINSFNFRDVQLIYLNAAFRKLEAVYNLIDTRAELLRLTGGIVMEY
jgi:outer membrane protein TolC